VAPLEFRDVVRALLDNSLDEVEAGRCTAIAVDVYDDAVRVSDNGRGLPVHPHPRSGRPLVEVILMGPRRGPRNTLARVNADCLWLEVEVHRDGVLWFQRHELAQPTVALHRKGAATRPQGTAISCAPGRGSAPSFDEVCELVRARGAVGPEGREARVRIRDYREARDETIVLA
jgi:DNA gyrase subunit B